MKKILLSLILLSTTISSFSQIFLKDGVYYFMLTDMKTVEVTSNNFGAYSGDMNIPSTVRRDGDTVTYKVAAIGNDAFHGCTELKSVTIPESVTIIGDNAFKGCTSMTKITLPESVTAIGSEAFYD